MPRTKKVIWNAACRGSVGLDKNAPRVIEKFHRAVVALIGLFIAAGVTATGRAQDPSVSAPQEKTTEQAYKNIQALAGLPASELDGVMYFMSAALGVGCNYCHKNPWDSDEKTAKVAARRMILMTRAINKENFGNNPAVTCYTCHRGQHNSEPLPPVALATTPAPDVNTPASAPAALPPAEELIGRYTRAIGGQAAIESMRTRVSRGTETTSNRMTPPEAIPVEIIQAAPDKILIARKSPGGETLEGFDGSKGWTKDARGQREAAGRELAEIRHEADFFRYLKIKQTYPQMRVLGREKVRDRDAYVVGATSRDESREKLYFDVETGLLLRRVLAFKTAFGALPEVTDFDDYREVSGVKLPFAISWSRPPFGVVRKFIEIKLNELVNNGRFGRSN